jgi:hypothetical protein
VNKIPFGNDADTWVLRNDNSIYHNAIRRFVIEQKFEEGDVIVSSIQLSLYKNKKPD